MIGRKDGYFCRLYDCKNHYLVLDPDGQWTERLAFQGQVLNKNSTFFFINYRTGEKLVGHKRSMAHMGLIDDGIRAGMCPICATKNEWDLNERYK